MALAASSLSQVCKGIRQYLEGELNGPTRSKVTVLLASPSETASLSGDAEHRLNLFFFRFESGGFFPDTLPGETGWLRSFCLVTPFATSEDSIGAGENDLRLVGEVIRVFQEKPVFLLSVDDEDYHLQVVFQPLGLDQLNQLWSTQGDTIYRPSALYEISLAPVVPAKAAIPAPLAGSIGFAARAAMNVAADGVVGQAPEVPYMKPVIALDDWAPAVAFVVDGHCALSLSFALGSAELAAFMPRIWIAGKPGAAATLRWETWDATSGWEKFEPPKAATASSAVLDPEVAAGAVTVAFALPFSDRVGQMLLYAERSYVRGSDGAALTVRSNPLLVSLFAA